jgi:DNA-binding transcriptional LysR family regulator
MRSHQLPSSSLTRATGAPVAAKSSSRSGPQKLPDLRALETFLTVCEAGSMVLAAQRLGITQSAVSQIIHVLEANYSVKLFDREVRPARPTRAGRTLLEMAGGLLSSARGLSEQLRHIVRQEHAQLRLGCVDSFAATVGPALVRALSSSTGQLQLWSGLTPGLNKQLLAQELDLAICTDVPMGDSRIETRLLFSECWVAVFPRGMAPSSLAEARNVKGISSALPLIRYTQRSAIGQQIERFLRHVGLDTPRRFEFDATDPMLSLVAAGLGWAISTPLCLWQSRVWLDQVDLLPIPGTSLGRRNFYLLCRDAEKFRIADDIAHITRTSLAHETLPAIRARMFSLATDAIVISEPHPSRKNHDSSFV